jgi:hypothetical protein
LTPQGAYIYTYTVPIRPIHFPESSFQRPEGRGKKIRVIHSVPDFGGFGHSFARISFHPAARNETLFEAATLQTGLQGHCWVEQLHGDGSCSRANSCANSCCSAESTLPPCQAPAHPCHNHHTPPSFCLQPPAELHPHAQHIAAPPCSGDLPGHLSLLSTAAASLARCSSLSARCSACARCSAPQPQPRPQLAARAKRSSKWSASLARSRSTRPAANAASEAAAATLGARSPDGRAQRNAGQARPFEAV